MQLLQVSEVLLLSTSHVSHDPDSMLWYTCCHVLVISLSFVDFPKFSFLNIQSDLFLRCWPKHTLQFPYPLPFTPRQIQIYLCSLLECNVSGYDNQWSHVLPVNGSLDVAFSWSWGREDMVSVNTKWQECWNLGLIWVNRIVINFKLDGRMWNSFKIMIYQSIYNFT